MSASRAETQELLTERRGPVLWVTFNRPEARNALTWNMYTRLVDVCEEVNRDRDVRAVVFTGAGGHAFVAGTDISQFRSFKTEKDALDYEARGNAVMATVESVGVPTIAAIAGPCTGAGAAIANCCDIRIGSPSARYGFPIARTLGNCLSVASLSRLTQLIGAGRTAELMMTARLLEASQALSLGLVTEVTADHASVLARAFDLARTLAGHAPLTLRATKEALRRLRIEGAGADDTDLITMTYMSDDFREGLEAFLAKRPPQWKGR